MAGVSMAFALHSALKISLAAAIPFAVAWGLAIMSLDRWLVVSLVRQQNKLNYLLLALPRVALGILFGLIISTPFTLQIFQPEINQQITLIQKQRADNFYKNLATDPLTKKIKADQLKVDNDEAIIRSNGGTGPNPANDPTVISLTQQLNQAVSKENFDYNKWHCELYGFPGHCVVGNGPAANADQQAYLADAQAVSIDRSAIAAQEQQIAANTKASAANNLANAQRDLRPDKAKLAADQAEQTQLENAFDGTNASNAGLLLRLQALDQVAASSGTLQAARWLLFLFFTVIECLPILVKVLLNLGPENSYEKAATQAERASLRLAEQETLRQYREAMLVSDALSDESERLHADWQRTVLPEIVHDTTAARERVARARLARWERRETVGSDDDGWTGPGGLSETGRLPGTDWTGSRRASTSTSSPMTSRLRAAWQALRHADAPQGPVSPSVGSYWPNA